MSSLQEECGVFGIFGTQTQDVAARKAAVLL